MTIYHKLQLFVLAGLAVTFASCSTGKLATQNADDVYFKSVEAIPVTYTAVPEKSYNNDNYSNRNGYDRNDDYYYDRYSNNLRFNVDTWRDNYSWRDYYYMNNYAYDPFYGSSSYLGFNNFYGNGWGFSLGYNSPLYSSNMPFYTNNYWNSYGSYYGNYPYGGYGGYGGIYSFYNQGYYGNYGGYYGGYGNPYYGGGVYYGGTARNLKARPRGSNDNMRGADGSNRMPIPDSRATRPNSAGDSNGRSTQSTDRDGNYNPYGRPTRSSGSSTDRRTQDQQQPSSQPTSRPSRPTRDSGSDSRGSSPEPTSRPSRSESPPSYTPSRSTESSGSSSGSSSSGSSSGGSSSGRPSR